MSQPVNNILFEDYLHSSLAGQVKGYAFVLADPDGIQAKVSGGWARDPEDGNVPMNTQRPSNIGSVSKVLSGVALLHLFESKTETRGAVNVQLNQPIWRFLPPKWDSRIPDRNKQITFRHLLQHKSGVRKPSSYPEEFDDIRICYHMINEVRASDFNVRAYENFNFSILTYLIPAIAYPSKCLEIHENHQDKDFIPYTKAVRIEYGKLFERYMKEEIFPKTIEPIRPSCNPPGDYPEGRYAFMYASRTDRRGSVYSAKEKEGSCRAQGGYYLSAQDVAIFACTFAFTDRYLSFTNQDLIYDPSTRDTRDDRLIFSERLVHSGFGLELGQDVWIYKAGSQTLGNGDAARAVLVRLPFDYYGVGIVNSVEFSTGQMAQVITEGFYRATRGQPFHYTKHAVREQDYQDMVDEMIESNNTLEWADFYDVNGQVFVNPIFVPETAGVLAKHDLTGSQFQDLFNTHIVSRHFRIKQVECYKKNGQVRYALIFVRGNGPDQAAYHGVSLEEHRSRFRDLEANGFVPVNVAVVSVEGNLLYTAFYEHKDVGTSKLRSRLTAQEFQEEFIRSEDEGLKLACVSAYDHQGQPHYSAIWYENLGASYVAKHNMSLNDYQSEFAELTGRGLSLKFITGCGVGSEHLFAAKWS